MKKNIISLLVLGTCIASYTGIPTELVDGLTDKAGEIKEVVGNMPADGFETCDKVIALIGDPQDNFLKAMRGFENAAAIFNPSAGHGNYDAPMALLDWKQVRDIVYDSYGTIPQDTAKE